MGPRTPAQLARLRRIEAGIRLVAPVLDLVLGAGDRLSRVVGRDEPEPEPPRRPLARRDPPRLPAGGTGGSTN